MVNEHRWYGWPGAFCMKCGCEDPYEIALADNNILYEFPDGRIQKDPYEGDELCMEVKAFIDPEKRHLYPLDECPVSDDDVDA
jgi:hypothetical protein